MFLTLIIHYENKLQAFEMCCYLRMLTVIMTKRDQMNKLLQILEQESNYWKIWLGHNIRMGYQGLIVRVLAGKIQCARKIGCSRHTYTTQACEDI